MAEPAGGNAAGVVGESSALRSFELPTLPELPSLPAPPKKAKKEEEKKREPVEDDARGEEGAAWEGATRWNRHSLENRAVWELHSTARHPSHLSAPWPHSSTADKTAIRGIRAAQKDTGPALDPVKFRALAETLGMDPNWSAEAVEALQCGVESDMIRLLRNSDVANISH